MPTREFKILVKRCSPWSEEKCKNRVRVSKAIENIKKYHKEITEQKNKITELKNPLEGFNTGQIK